MGLKTSFLLLAALALGLVAATPLIKKKEIHPDTGLNVLDLIARYGYPLESHWVTTEDGYILGMHRIPHGINNADETNKPVVLLMHGLLSSSADYCNNGGPEKSLAFLLADRGYDVWLGNARGNTWSRNHTTLSPDDDADEFWDFSWNEIGYYDLPAKINYIIEQTGVSSIFYAGHSQGTTSFFVMASTRPEMNEKITLMSALAPVAYMSNMANPLLHLLASMEGTLEVIMDLIGVNEFMPHTELLEMIGLIACQEDSSVVAVCSNILFLIAGYDSQELDEELIPVYTTNAPAGAATRQMLHYAQGINNGLFRKYDFGLFKNLQIYGQPEPPKYDMSLVTCPVALYYSSNDWLAAVEDVEQLYRELSHVIYKYLVPLEAFNHLDFIWAIDVYDLVYDKLISNMDRYNQK